MTERGGVTNATQAVVVTGRFKLARNQIAGFDKTEGTVRPVR